MESMESCCLLQKIKFCLSIKDPGAVIPFMAKEFSIPSLIPSQNTKSYELWRDSGTTVFFMEKDASRTMINLKENGSSAMKDNSKMDKSQASVLKESKTQSIEVSSRKDAEMEKEGFNWMEVIFLTVTSIKVS